MGVIDLIGVAVVDVPPDGIEGLAVGIGIHVGLPPVGESGGGGRQFERLDMGVEAKGEERKGTRGAHGQGGIKGRCSLVGDPAGGVESVLLDGLFDGIEAGMDFIDASGADDVDGFPEAKPTAGCVVAHDGESG